MDQQDATNIISHFLNQASQAATTIVIISTSPSISSSFTPASDAAPSSNSPKGGPRIKQLFPDDSTTEREKQRLLDYFRAHKLGSNALDSSKENSGNRIAVCFFREWRKRHLLTPKVGATHLVRFLKADCGLSLTVEEKALANRLSKMINNQQFDTDWGGSVCEAFQK